MAGDLDKLLAEAGQTDRVDAGAFRFRFDRTLGADETLTEDITGSAELLTAEPRRALGRRSARL